MRATYEYGGFVSACDVGVVDCGFISELPGLAGVVDLDLLFVSVLLDHKHTMNIII